MGPPSLRASERAREGRCDGQRRNDDNDPQEVVLGHGLRSTATARHHSGRRRQTLNTGLDRALLFTLMRVLFVRPREGGGVGGTVSGRA